ncbi:class C sortase [Candidatus Enterococcus willemsii]|uniref:Class C sortase n=1 Tax=Candidatus Enterococcus willemsii TaxID=1857215 RepID=A0ABQ6YVV4_9ENTE|nr:class C sortase [Enterococcus sp. CU12B]KAF1301451.1 hypothetical protein BAU17_05875 [Enterococcus sp. CU12B]
MAQQQKNERMNVCLKLLMAVLFLTGAAIFSYPFVADTINNYYDQKILEKLHREQQSTHQKENQQRLQQMSEENMRLVNQLEPSIPDFSLLESVLESALQQTSNPGKSYFENRTLGALYIPKITVSLPIFSETNATLLDHGVTVLQGTSFPIGGKNTHAVLTGHSGLPTKKLLTDLEKLEVGDLFYLDIVTEKLAYQVIQLKTVLPTELEDLAIQEEKDLVTLVTCTPYMVNTHRLLVTAQRVPYKEEMAQEKQQTRTYHYRRFRVMLICIPLFFGTVFYWMWRKLVYYQCGKYTYDFVFTVLGADTIGHTLGIARCNNPKKILQTTTIQADGQVTFKQLRGGKYFVKKLEATADFPVIKGYVFRVKDSQFRLRKGRYISRQKQKYIVDWRGKSE